MKKELIEELKKKATVRVHSYGAFGEHEYSDEVDLDKFAEIIIKTLEAPLREAMGEFIYEELSLEYAIEELVQGYKAEVRSRSMYQRELNAAEEELDNVKLRLEQIKGILKD